MRPDMTKKVVEGGRRGGRSLDVRPRRRGEEWEHYPQQAGMKRLWKDLRSQTDTLNPFYRFLESRVGKPWDTVWSEIAATMDFRSVLGSHIKSHLDSYVNKHVRIINGVPHEVLTTRWADVRGWTPLRPGDLFVHPGHGLLTRVKGAKRRHSYFSPRVDPNVKKLDAENRLERIKGIWYHVRFHTETYKTLNPSTRELVERIHTHEVKEQLSKRRLRAHNLTNTPVSEKSETSPRS